MSDSRRIDVTTSESHAGNMIERRIEWRTSYASRSLVAPLVTLWFPDAAPLAPVDRLDSAALAVLFPAMQDRATVVLHGVVSPQLLENLVEFQRAWACWRRDRYGVVPLRAEAVAAAAPARPETLAAFSGGVDSGFTMLRHGRCRNREVTGLFMHGFDIPLVAADGFAGALAAARAMLADIGRPLVAGATDVRAACRTDWEDSHGAMLGMIAHQLSPGFDRFLVPGSSQYHRLMLPWGSNPITDPLLGSETLRVSQDGVDCTRLAKLAALADWPEALRRLRVCWERAATGGNCGRCEKCVETWLAFRFLGLDPTDCFPTPPNHEAIADLEIRSVSDAIEGWKFLTDAGLQDPLHGPLRDALLRFERRLEPSARRELAKLDPVLSARASVAGNRGGRSAPRHPPLGLATGAFAAELDALLGGRPCARVDWPDHGNVGDHLIWLGEKLALRQMLGGRVGYEAAAAEAAFAALTALPVETVLVMHGGGNFGDLYPRHQRFREEVVRRFPERTIICMPQSICYRDPQGLAATLAVYETHSALTVFLRDRASYDLIRALTADPRYRLAPDAALFLADHMPALLSRLPACGRQAVVQLFRSDGEADAARPHPVKEWPCYDWLHRVAVPAADYAERAMESLTALGLSDVLDSPFDRVSWANLQFGMEILNVGQRLVTDRLHGHILALLMGKPHTVYDTNNGKIRSFSETWSWGDPLVQWMRCEPPAAGQSQPAPGAGSAAGPAAERDGPG